ncbi:L,D-transpeptidase [Streptomyces sp. KM273126]|uniref:L,D-transpeptidase n=1 Tax=Streptomyces sp. KM273126 TaxID=2545247 RepID=UPI00103DA435|nr:L,D-transpeptidase [Streptomyces sp. KM273126]MBA2807753.1 L,D-transpeptidase [Streptomyces sp. KM273126]
MSDELSTRLRELAASQSIAPTVSGAGIRSRAVRRGRRRRAAAALGTGAVALAVVAFTLTLDLGADPDHPDRRRIPAATLSAPPSAATAVPVTGTVHLRGRTLTVGDRVMPISSGAVGTPTPTGLMRVVATYDMREMAVDVSPEGRSAVKVLYVVELRDTEDEPVYVGALPDDLKALGTYDVTDGWIGLGADDAEWFSTRIRPGDHISVISTTPPTATLPTASPATASPVTALPPGATTP